MHKVMTLVAQNDATIQAEARMAPAIVTARQPHRFTKALEIGPKTKRFYIFWHSTLLAVITQILL